MDKPDKPKRFVLVRTEWGELFVLKREVYNEAPRIGEIVAESNEMLSLMRFKDLTKEV